MANLMISRSTMYYNNDKIHWNKSKKKRLVKSVQWTVQCIIQAFEENDNNWIGDITAMKQAGMITVTPAMGGKHVVNCPFFNASTVVEHQSRSI